MDIISKIREVVEGASGLDMYYDTPQTLNYRIDNASNWPAVLLHVIKSGTADDTLNVIRERLDITLIFATLGALDFDGAENEQTRLDNLKKRAFKTALAFRTSNYFSDVRVIGTNRIYADDDVILTAFTITLSITEREGVSDCTNIDF